MTHPCLLRSTGEVVGVTVDRVTVAILIPRPWIQLRIARTGAAAGIAVTAHDVAAVLETRDARVVVVHRRADPEVAASVVIGLDVMPRVRRAVVTPAMSRRVDGVAVVDRSPVCRSGRDPCAEYGCACQREREQPRAAT